LGLEKVSKGTGAKEWEEGKGAGGRVLLLRRGIHDVSSGSDRATKEAGRKENRSTCSISRISRKKKIR